MSKYCKYYASKIVSDHPCNAAAPRRFKGVVMSTNEVEHSLPGGPDLSDCERTRSSGTRRVLDPTHFLTSCCRRGFLWRAGWMAGWGALVGSLSHTLAAESKTVSLDTIRLAQLQKQVGTRFTVRTEGGREGELELIQASPPERIRQFRPVHGRFGPRCEQFSLLFRGDSQNPLEQQIHRLDHRELGTLSWFLVPVLSRDKDHRYYEAVFDRSVPVRNSALPRRSA